MLASIFAESKKLRHSPTAEVFRAGYVELNKLSQAKSTPDSSKKVNDPTALIHLSTKIHLQMILHQ